MVAVVHLVVQLYCCVAVLPAVHAREPERLTGKAGDVGGLN